MFKGLKMKKISVLTSVFLSVVLAGCGSHDNKSGNTQVVAKVNDKEITVHQLNFALSKVGKVDPAQLKPASEKVLQQLVDLELLAQKSLDSKLDRDPNVLQVLEATKQQVLAQAYLQKIAGNQTPPTADEINKFYQDHPELFSDRRVYVIREFLVKDGAANAEKIKADIGDVKTSEEIASKLKAANFVFNVNASKRSAEQLPAEVAIKLRQMNEKDVLLANNQTALGLFFLEKVDKEPVDLEKAKPYIQQFLVNSKQQTLIKNEVAAIRKAAEVNFYGEFKDVKLGETTNTALKKDAPVNPQPTPVAPAADANNKPENRAIEKGLSGL